MPVRDKPMVRLHPLLLQQVREAADQRKVTYNWLLERTVALGLSVLLDEEA